MALVTTTEMFKKAYEGGYAIGAFNVNNMEIVQAITEAAGELKSPVILQVSAGARKYANATYLRKLVEAAVIENPGYSDRSASGSRRRLRDLQVLYRWRIYFRYDRCFQVSVPGEHRDHKEGC